MCVATNSRRCEWGEGIHDLSKNQSRERSGMCQLEGCLHQPVAPAVCEGTRALSAGYDTDVPCTPSMQQLSGPILATIQALGHLCCTAYMLVLQQA